MYGLDISHSEFVAVQIIFTHETFEELIFSTLKILMALDQGIQGSLKRVLDVVETGPYEKQEGNGPIDLRAAVAV